MVYHETNAMKMLTIICRNTLEGEIRRLLNDLKLMFAALGAGNSVVPLGDNARAARLLSEYAASLQKH